ncbi:MAG TPA: PEGA domain-containing protein [Vicinamibacterales bacterium]|jgi:PEGA domain|nr:PEGA domain-containing protein [Vicinamibacterales bacterium]
MSAVTKRVVIFTAGLTMLGAISVSASPRHAVIVEPRVVVHRPFYDPAWGPWYWGPYAYAYPYPYDVYGQANIRTEVNPKDTQVYVDGYYAGRVSDFDGAFKRLHVAPGGHSITFYREGFRTITQDVYARPDSTFKMNENMEPLAPGQSSAPVPTPAQG